MKIEIDKVIDMYTSLAMFGKVVRSGSYFINGCLDNDVDFFMNYSAKLKNWLEKEGFECPFEENYADNQAEKLNFFSYRKGYFNVILVYEKKDLDNIQLATDLCTELNLLNKEHRILVFRAIRNGTLTDNKKVIDGSVLPF